MFGGRHEKVKKRRGGEVGVSVAKTKTTKRKTKTKTKANTKARKKKQRIEEAYRKISLRKVGNCLKKTFEI